MEERDEVGNLVGCRVLHHIAAHDILTGSQEMANFIQGKLGINGKLLHVIRVELVDLLHVLLTSFTESRNGEGLECKWMRIE